MLNGVFLLPLTWMMPTITIDCSKWNTLKGRLSFVVLTFIGFTYTFAFVFLLEFFVFLNYTIHRQTDLHSSLAMVLTILGIRLTVSMQLLLRQFSEMKIYGDRKLPFFSAYDLPQPMQLSLRQFDEIKNVNEMHIHSSIVKLCRFKMLQSIVSSFFICKIVYGSLFQWVTLCPC